MYNGHAYFSKFTERLEFQFRKEDEAIIYEDPVVMCKNLVGAEAG